jgi:polyphenol oxidase
MTTTPSIALGWLAAQAPWPPGVRAGCTLRHGGGSQPPWDALNLGDHVGDAPEQVARNRAQLRAFCQADTPYLQQVHGTAVVQVPLAPASAPVTADAAWADVPGVAALVMVADCLPVLWASADGRWVAAAHAGWRGLVGQHGRGVLEALCEAAAAQPGGGPDRASSCVWLGPCIGPEAFEVGQEVFEAFVANCPSDAVAFRAVPVSSGPVKWAANLPLLARLRLQRLGFERLYGNDGSAPWCTHSQPSRFFSHRRDAAVWGSTGRMAALIWREANDPSTLP